MGITLMPARNVIRLLVTGGRDYTDKKTVCKVLNSFLKKVENKPSRLVVIHGDARGLDTIAGRWCDENGVPCIAMSAPWSFYNNAAGPVRNEWMLKYAMPTHAHVFPGGKGTADMHKRAVKAGLKVSVTEAE